MMSDSDSDDPNLPSAAECDMRCKEFAAVTKTDTALAMFFLQDRGWDLQRSLSDYFQSIDMENFNSSSSASASSLQPINGLQNPITHALYEEPKDFVDPEPHRIRLMSWNIDGLDTSYVKARAKSVCRTISSERPDVVYLQELVTKNLEVIKEECSDYSIVLGTDTGVGHGNYFTAVLLRRNTTEYLSHLVKPFYSSIMTRTLLHVVAKVKGVEVHLLTSHLESTSSQEVERLKQLKVAFEEASSIPEDSVVIFGGDLNLRDSEFQKIGDIADGFTDIWEETGKRPEAQYTWDMKKNDNLELSFRFKPRCRFDRLYYRGAGLLQAVYFELVGFQRDSECKRFPSDHWGIMAHFNKTSHEKAVGGGP